MVDAQQQISPLSGLRGLAAISVMVAHAIPLTALPKSMAPSLGVMLFFALSGFLIGHLYLTRQFSLASILDYAVARFARVYPLFAVVVIGAALVLAATGYALFFQEVGDLVPHLLLGGSGWTVWTISSEFQFYAAFVLLWGVYALIPRRKDETLIAVAGGVFLLLWWAGFPGDRISLSGYLHIFLLGVVASIVYRRVNSEWMRRVASWAFPIALATYIDCLFLIDADYQAREIYRNVALCVVVTVLVLGAAAAPDTFAVRWLASRQMVWLGEVSFGVYLMHYPAMGVLRALGAEWWQLSFLRGPILLTLIVGLTLAMAWAANVYIEKPARKWLRETRLVPRRAAPAE